MAKVSVIQANDGIGVSDSFSLNSNYDNKIEEEKMKANEFEDFFSIPQFNSFNKHRTFQNLTGKNTAQNFIEKYKAELLSLQNVHTKWMALHPEHWTPDEVIDWLYYFADSNGIDCSRFRAEAFQDKTGRELCLMNLEHFNQLDPLYGKQIYNYFHTTILSSSEMQLLNNEDFINSRPNVYTELLNADNFSTSLSSSLSSSSSSSSSSSPSLSNDPVTTTTATISVPGRTNSNNHPKLTDNWTSHVCSQNYYDIKADERNHYRGDEYHESATAFEVLENNKYIPSSIYDENPKFWSTHLLPPSTDIHHPHHPQPITPNPNPPLNPRHMTLIPPLNTYSLSSSSSFTHEMSVPPNTQLQNNNKDEDHRHIVKSERKQTKIKKFGQGSKGTHLWEFIRDLLHDGNFCPRLIKWEDPNMGVFRFVQSEAVAQMWGQKKNNTSMTYEKLSRAMRYYYKRGILLRVDGRRLVYRFGPRSYGWKQSGVAQAETCFFDRFSLHRTFNGNEVK